MYKEFIKGFKTITKETRITDLIPKGYYFVNDNVDYEYDTDHPNSVLKIEIQIKKKSKTLEDYENEFLINHQEWGSKLKLYHKKQYYSIILQMIADDICEEGRIKKCTIQRDFKVMFYGEDIISRADIGTVLFDTTEHAKQAIEIMEDKINLLI
jgi:hypothetical protein